MFSFGSKVICRADSLYICHHKTNSNKIFSSDFTQYKTLKDYAMFTKHFLEFISNIDRDLFSSFKFVHWDEMSNIHQDKLRNKIKWKSKK